MKSICLYPFKQRRQRRITPHMFEPTDTPWTPAHSNSSYESSVQAIDARTLTVLGPDALPATGTPREDAPPAEAPSRFSRFSALASRWLTAAGERVLGSASLSERDERRCHEPCAEVVNQIIYTSNLAQWEPLPPPETDQPFQQDVRDPFEEEEEENYDVDLVAALRYYRRLPNDFYASIVSAAISQRSPTHFPIEADELMEADAIPFLVSQIVTSGCLRYEDPAVTQLLTQYMSQLIDADPSFVSPSVFEYLRSLCHAPTLRVTAAQRDKLLRSGFEFVKLLEEFPQLSVDVGVTLLSTAKLMLRTWLDLPLLLFGFALVLFELTSFVFLGIMWYIQDRNIAYYSLLVYLGGFAVDLLITNGVGRTDMSVYGEDFVTLLPSANLKIMPFLPLYQGVLVVSILRHKVRRWRMPAESADTSRYFTIEHDLYAAHVVNLAIHAICISFPQFLLQTYFFDQSSKVVWDFVYRIVLAATGAVCAFAIVLVIRQTLLFSSINSFGFAQFGTERSLNKKVRRSGPRMLSYIFVFFFEQGLFYFIIGIVMFDACIREAPSVNRDVVVYIALKGGVVASCLALFIGVPWCPVKAVYGFAVPIVIEIAAASYVEQMKGRCSSLFTQTLRQISLAVGIACATVGFCTILFHIAFRCRQREKT